MLFFGKNIFIISPELWGENYISKHHYALKLAEQGNNVYFFNPPGNLFAKKMQAKGLTVIDYKPLLRGVNKMPRLLRDAFSSFDIKRVLKKLQIPAPDIVWSFDSFRFHNLNIFGQEVVKIYYAADLRKTTLEQALLDSASIVLAPSNQILKRFTTKTPLHFINHGLSSQFLKEYLYRFPEKGQRLKAGYIGNVVSRFIDYKLLLHTIDNNPEINFYFIGPYEISNLTVKIDADIQDAIAELKQKKNVILMGPKPPQELPSHYEYLDFFWLCYDTEKYYDEASNSHKIIEYLSTGKPVISTIIDTYKNSGLLEMPGKNASFSDIFSGIGKNYVQLMTAEKVEERLRFARENTYAKQIAKIEQYINCSG